MAELLRTIWAGEVLNETNTGLLLNIMKRCETGDVRLKGMLPECISVIGVRKHKKHRNLVFRLLLIFPPIHQIPIL